MVIPYLGDDGEWLGFVARAISDDVPGPKYLTPSGMDRKHSVWAQLHTPQDPRVFLLEGVFDGLRLLEANLNVIATWGKSVTLDQIHRVCSLTPGRPVYVCLDGDAWQDCELLAIRLALYKSDAAVRWCKLPAKSDPGSLGAGVLRYVQPEKRV